MAETKAVTHARPKAKDQKKDGKDKAPTFPSDFGSHASMTNAATALHEIDWRAKRIRRRPNAPTVSLGSKTSRSFKISFTFW